MANTAVDTVVDSTAPKLASLADVRDYFGLNGKEMVSQWRKLPETDRVALRTGVGNGTYTY